MVPSYLPPHASARVDTFDSTTDHEFAGPVEKPKTNIVAMYKTKTPPLQNLPQTAVEIAALERLTHGREDVSLHVFAEVEATPANLLRVLPSAQVFHVALHGVHDTFPLQSALVLSVTGAEEDTVKMTVEWLLNTVGSLETAEPIFLSACQTSAAERELASWADVVVHLAAAMLFAGFRGAIAAMWSIDDADGPVIAEDTYKYLLSDSKTEERRGKAAAHGLHSAIRNFRSRDVPRIRWVPFVHIGE